MNVLRRRTRLRNSWMCVGGIQDSGRRPSCNSLRRWRASSRSVLARLGTPQRPGVGRLGQMGLQAGSLQLLDQEAPAGGRLQVQGSLLPLEALQPAARALSSGGGCYAVIVPHYEGPSTCHLPAPRRPDPRPLQAACRDLPQLRPLRPLVPDQAHSLVADALAPLGRETWSVILSALAPDPQTS